MSDIQNAIDQRLNDAISTANYRVTLTNQKNNIVLKLQRSLTYSIGGGTFTINRELISFIAALLSQDAFSAVLLDNNNNPVDIEDLKEFMNHILNIYHEASFTYMAEYRELSKARTVKTLIGE